MALLHSDPAELHGIQPEWSWMQWLPFPVYEFFPRWPAYSSDAFCFRNLNI